MIKRALLVLVLSLLVMTIASYAEEKLTITTYYPAPQGPCNELRCNKAALGDNFKNATNRWGSEISTNADLVVEENVGIGTLKPNDQLEVYSAGASARLRISNNNASGQEVLSMKQGTINKADIYYDNASNTLNFYTYPSSSKYLFRTTDSSGLNHSVDIDPNGNVGIGTSPGEKLDVNGDIRGRSVIYAGANEPAANRWVGIGAINLGGTICQFLAGNYDAPLHFGFANNKDLTGGVAYLTLYPNYRVGIGTANASVDPQSPLHIYAVENNNYVVKITQAAGSGHGLLIDSSLAGSALKPLAVRRYDGTNLFYVTGNGDYYLLGNSLSKREDKRDIKPFTESGINLLKNIKLVRFNYKKDEPSRIERIGFIANDKDNVIDDRLTNNKTSFGTDTIVTVLIKAVQEQQKEIESLRKDIEQLKSKSK
ncbi:MAG: tail fiber domain-containing protein [Candidatus Omnitrophica bacterium]|nr:tail fiber domain-containing protein [Candidatus Omnitrophota bacterium]